MVKSKDLVPLLLFLILSGILIFSWFRFGLIYGGGDTGLPTYNPQTMVNIARYIWWDSLAPGVPVAQGLTSVPMLFTLSILQTLGASPVFIQAFLFLVLLFLMGYGMYLLSLNIFGKDKYYLALAAGVFYLFNPYMMIQIWHRFIHNAIVFAAFLPFLVLTWLWWIRKRHLFYLLLFLIVNFLAVYIYGTIAFIVAVWILLFLLTLLEGLVNWKGIKVASGLVTAFFIGWFFWLLTNSWWLIPTFNVSPVIFAAQHNVDDSLAILIELSSQTVLPYLLRLINPFYLYWYADWGSIYQNIFFVFISWLFVIVVFIGFLRGFKQKQYIIWSILFLIVIFLSKGAASPFGFLYIFGFSNFFPLGVIRNPFEKLGILLPLVYAILFALGLQVLLSTGLKYLGKSATIFVLTFFICLHLVFLWPMFAGKVFGTLYKQNFVSVPQSYTQANEWIKEDLRNTPGTSLEGRILHLPLPRSEDATYNWEYGYSGVEPSAAIFTALPSIARGLNTPRIIDILSGLSLVFHKPYASNPAVILKMLQDFSIKYIILHKDIQWLAGELYNPLETEGILDRLEFLERQGVFGDLVIYKLTESSFRPKIIISDDVELLHTRNRNLFWPWMVSTPSAEMVSIVSNEPDERLSINKDILDKINKILVLPVKGILSENFEIPEFQGNLDYFNSVRILPNSPIYSLISVKEALSLIGKSELEKQMLRIVFAEKRLVEMYKIWRMQESGIISNEKGEQIVNSELERYRKTILEVFDKGLIPGTVVINGYHANTRNVFLKHISLLNQVEEGLSDQEEEKRLINNLVRLINKLLVDKGLIPEYQLKDQNYLTQQYNQRYFLDVPLNLNYEVLMNRPEVSNIYPNNLSELDFWIDDQLKKMSRVARQNLMSFGEVELESGKHTINILGLPSANLVSNFDNMKKEGRISISDTGVIEIVSGKQDPSYIEGDIVPAYGGDNYLISFEFQMLSGVGIRIQVNEDTDQTDEKGIANSGYNNNYIPGSVSRNQWLRFEGSAVLRLTTQKAKLKIQAEPWDDCVTVLNDKKRCSDVKVRQQYNQPTRFLIKNINVSKLLSNDIFLRANLPVDKSSTPSGTVQEAKKINSSQYFGKLSIKRPTLVFFKESFDPGWELILNKGEDVYKPKSHLVANSFANAWIVEETGDYDFTISYRPQKFIKVGILLAGLGWVIIAIILVVGYNFRRLIIEK